jgi:glyceraldehyde-3-phosphate dehydrogenase (NADP+)
MPADFFLPISDQKTPPTYKYFNGKDWIESLSGKKTEIISPVDGSIVGKLQVNTTQEIDAVVEKAYEAQRSWEQTPMNQRAKIVHLAADWIREYQEYLISLMVMEIGKTYSESKSEVIRTADLIDYYAQEVQSIKGETLDSDNFPGFEKGRIALIERVPYGVVLAIAPFNYPVNLSASKIAPALLMGNSVIFKPPTQGGISGLHLARIFQKAGVPEGVLTCVTGGGSEIGNYLVSHKKIDMIAFTGSSDTGAAIAKMAGMIPLLFECGGNNAAIVLPDADMSLTAKEIVKGAFSYAGQRCTAIKYVIGTPAVLDQILPKVVETTKELVHMGDPRSPHTKLVGPLISETAVQVIDQVINEAVKKGAQIVYGGKKDKAYLEPTILKGVKPEMQVVSREQFGPVLSFIQVDSVDQAVVIVNESHYGLQACIFSNDEGTGIVLANRLKVGSVQLNGSPQRGPDHFPFLGVKGSGVGVQGVRYSLEAVSRLKPIVINKPQ